MKRSGTTARASMAHVCHSSAVWSRCCEATVDTLKDDLESKYWYRCWPWLATSCLVDRGFPAATTKPINEQKLRKALGERQQRTSTLSRRSIVDSDDRDDRPKAQLTSAESLLQPLSITQTLLLIPCWSERSTHRVQHSDGAVSQKVVGDLGQCHSRLRICGVMVGA